MILTNVGILIIRSQSMHGKLQNNIPTATFMAISNCYIVSIITLLIQIQPQKAQHQLR